MLTKIIKRISLIVLSYLLTYSVFGSGRDSTLIEQLKYKANTSLKRLVDYNKQMIKSGHVENLNFVVEIDDSPFPVGDSAVFQRSVMDPPYDFISTQKHSELNNYLKQVYVQEGIACYMVFINYFKYKLSIRLSDEETITNIVAYQSKFSEVQRNKQEDPAIERIKAIHARVSKDVYATITKDHPFVFMNIAAYCKSGGTGLTCDYFGLHYYSGLENNTILSHLKELIKTKFRTQYEQYTDKEVIAENEVYSLAAAVKQARIKSQILTTINQDALCSILNESDFPFNGLTFVSTAYAALTIAERIHAIQIFLDGRVGGTWSSCNAEQKLISIVKNTPPEQIDSFLLNLENEKLVDDLISSIDDFGPGGNNYEALLKIFSELVLKSPTFEQRFYDYQNASLVSSRAFFWDRNYFLSMVQTPVGTNKYTIELLENQQVKVFHTYVKEWRLTGFQAKSDIPLYKEVWESDANPTLLRPFELVLFIDRSNLGLIEGSTVGGELGMAVMPAIFLKYAHDKKFNANTLKGIAVAFDVATLVTGPGLIAKVFQAGTRIRKAMVIADILNSGLNLSINMIEPELDPRFKTAVDLYNGLMLTIGAGKILKNGITKAGDVLNQLGDFISSLSKQAVKDYLTAIRALRMQLKAANFNVIDYCKNNKSAENIFALEDQLRKEWHLRFPNESLPLPTNFYLNVSDDLQNLVRSKIPNKAEELLDLLNENSVLRQEMGMESGLIDSWEFLKNKLGSSIIESDILKFYTIDRAKESFEILETNNIFPTISNITKNEGSALHRYTVNNFELSAHYYANVLNPSEKAWSRIISNALNKLRTTNLYEGIIYRGSNLDEQLVKQKYFDPFTNAANGEIPICYEAPFWSTSKSIDVAEDFIKRFSKQGLVEVLFKIQSKTGVYIDDISDYGSKLGPIRHPGRLSQLEVIQKNGLNYRILNAVKTVKADGKIRYFVELTEL